MNQRNQQVKRSYDELTKDLSHSDAVGVIATNTGLTRQRVGQILKLFGIDGNEVKQREKLIQLWNIRIEYNKN